MKHKGFTLVELAIVIFIVCIIVAVLLPPNWNGRSRHNAYRASCQSNLRQIGLAFLQYTQDYNEQFPPAAHSNIASSTQPFRKPYGWADAIQPYLKTTQLYQCPSEDNHTAGTDATQPKFTDYWMNSNLAKLNINKIQETAQILLGGEGNDGTDATNARYNMNALPASWRTDESKPSFRHLGTANYLFADGHVKAIKVSRIQNKANKLGAPTFAID